MPRPATHVFVLLLVFSSILIRPPQADAGGGPIVGIGSVHAGVYSTEWEASADLDAMAAWTTKRTTFSGTFHNVMESEGSNWSKNTEWQLEQAWQGQATPIVNLTIDASSASIAAGSWDSAIITWANRVKKWTDRNDGPQRTLFIAPLQEHNGDWVPYGCDPANFKAAYARIRSLVQGVGLDETLVRWVWAPNGWTSNKGACNGKTLADYYPGSDIVDAIGYSAYRWGDGGVNGQWGSNSVAFVAGGVANELRTIDAKKPYILLQTAAWKTGSGERNLWTRELFEWAAQDPNMVGIVWFNHNKETDWRIWDSTNQVGLIPGWKDALQETTTAYQWPLSNWFQPGPLSFSPVPLGELSNRQAGSNRWATSVAVSRATFAPGVRVAYVATGYAFPDALAAAAAAGAMGGPVLLVPGSSIPANVIEELKRLDPARIVVVGGANAVSDEVLRVLEGIQPNSVRIGGSNRFATAGMIATDAFGYGVPIAYVATGRDFPDALAAAAAAGAQGGPVLLTESWGLPDATRQALLELTPDKIVVVGGTNAVSSAVEDALRALQPNTIRIAGSNRYDTAAKLAGFVTGPDLVFVATGLDFPDALAGAAAAGYLRVPLLLTMPTEVPAPTAAALASFNPNPAEVIVLGGNGVISEYVSWQLKVASQR